jgi:hypothetical protein
VPGTPVLLADGTSKPIEDIEIGDEVRAADPETGEDGPRVVSALIRGTGSKNLVDVTVDTDGDAGRKTGRITATDGHPFWVDARGWIEADDVRQGDTLRTPSGELVEVAAVRSHKAVTTVYNLSVEGLHTYHVDAGGTSVLVHNCGGLIRTTARGVDHTLQRHFRTGAQSAGKSHFFDTEMVHQLAGQAQGTPFAFRQGSGRVQHVVPDAGRDIGIDRTTGLPTRTYTVVTEAGGDMVTMFPGLPGQLGTPIFP